MTPLPDSVSTNLLIIIWNAEHVTGAHTAMFLMSLGWARRVKLTPVLFLKNFHWKLSIPKISNFHTHCNAQRKPWLTLEKGAYVRRSTWYIPGHIPWASLALVVSLLVLITLIFLTGDTAALVIFPSLLTQKYMCFSPIWWFPHHFDFFWVEGCSGAIQYTISFSSPRRNSPANLSTYLNAKTWFPKVICIFQSPTEVRVAACRTRHLHAVGQCHFILQTNTDKPTPEPWLSNYSHSQPRNYNLKNNFGGWSSCQLAGWSHQPTDTRACTHRPSWLCS